MTLTYRLQLIANCFPDPKGEPDDARLESAEEELFAMIKDSKRFPTEGAIRLLDVGSGDEGSYFVNRYGERFPNVEVVYLDSFFSFLKQLDKPNKVCANATQMPFPDGSFDIAYAGYVMSDGILKDHFHFKDESYQIAKESHRILKQGGLFFFTYIMGDDIQTLENLSEIGFKKIEHLQRITWMHGMPTDTYAVTK
jgi:SAM-dependent methyltransferase